MVKFDVNFSRLKIKLMKKSNKVLLTTLFLAAVSSYAAKSQNVNHEDGGRTQSDSTSSRHTAFTSPASRHGFGRGFGHLFSGHS